MGIEKHSICTEPPGLCFERHIYLKTCGLALLLLQSQIIKKEI